MMTMIVMVSITSSLGQESMESRKDDDSLLSIIASPGPSSKETFAFKWYNKDEVILGKPMKDWLRFSVAFWHSQRGDGSDPFGAPTRRWVRGRGRGKGKWR